MKRKKERKKGERKEKERKKERRKKKEEKKRGQEECRRVGLCGARQDTKGRKDHQASPALSLVASSQTTISRQSVKDKELICGMDSIDFLD